jgi:hypothetical protein
VSPRWLRSRETIRLPGKDHDEEELKKLANDFLTLALGLDVQEITDLAAISASEGQS